MSGPRLINRLCLICVTRLESLDFRQLPGILLREVPPPGLAFGPNTAHEDARPAGAQLY
jgi:hypothetical protein